MTARASVVINTSLKKLPWMVSAVIIFSLNYGSSYAALLWQPASPKVDTRSALTADYRPRSFLKFQPLDPAIIKEIQQERKLPDQLVIPGSFWPTAEVQSPDQNPVPSEIPDTQPSETTMPAEVTESPVASASPLPPTPVTTLPAPVVTAIPTQISNTPVPYKPLDSTSPPREKPTKKPHPPHPDNKESGDR